MAKQGMRRYRSGDVHGGEGPSGQRPTQGAAESAKNDLPPVPEIQGKAKCGKKKASVQDSNL